VKTGAAKALGRAAVCAALASACAPAWLILRYGVDVPYWDQWETVFFFEKLARGSLTAADLFAQQNEYRQFFPNLLFVALGRLTNWNVKYEMLASLLLACLVAWGVWRLGARTFGDTLRRGLLFLTASLLIFSPIQFENWLFGVQVVYFVPVACVVAGLCVAYSEKFETRVALVVCACLSAVSTFSSANGVLCWLVLPLVLLAARPRARASVRLWLPPWCAGVALCVALYLQGYRSPASHPSTSEALRHPLDALAYFVALLGGPLAVGPRSLAVVVAVVVGTCALAAYVFACAYLFKFRADAELVRRSTAWAALGAYSLGTAALVTAGRLGYGIGQSLTSRYTTFTLYLLVALAYLLPCVVEDAARRKYLAAGRLALLKRLGAAAAVLFVLAHVVVFALVVRHSAADWRRARLRAKACLLFVEVAPEERCLAEGLSPNVGLLRERAASLDRLGYLRPPLVREGRMRGLATVENCMDGSFKLLSTEGGAYVLEGVAWLPHRGEPADAVVLAYGMSDEDQTAFALAEVGAIGSRDDARWRKSFSVGAWPTVSTVKFTAWAFDAEEGKAYRLCEAHAADAARP
jgi:hypothetical protein